MTLNNSPKIQLFTNSSGDATFNVTIVVKTGYRGSYDYVANVEEIKMLTQKVIDSLQEPVSGNPISFDVLGKATVPGSQKIYICTYVVTIMLAEPSRKKGGNPFYDFIEPSQAMSEKSHICRYNDFPPARHRYQLDGKVAMLNEDAQDLYINRYSVHVQFLSNNMEEHPIAFATDLDNLRNMINLYIFPDLNPCDRTFYARVDMGGNLMTYAKVTMAYRGEEVYPAPVAQIEPTTADQRKIEFRDMIDDLSRRGVFQNL
ncbi:hypothetical protein EFA69_14625 [Rufibacter immobilis]|uniref:Uncharacterized protein n=1 Tax=Rufibacter immobilis TaxID=1348778 RepID=A0A3M9MPD7_9BACT|nr:hypothetical protein [Rufibacter immobilis]RNI27371.1 hypothetical protein EFA69_14625 [Rufibacter immobilis]